MWSAGTHENPGATDHDQVTADKGYDLERSATNPETLGRPVSNHRGFYAFDDAHNACHDEARRGDLLRPETSVDEPSRARTWVGQSGALVRTAAVSTVEHAVSTPTLDLASKRARRRVCIARVEAGDVILSSVVT